MFYDRFLELCEAQGVKPKKVVTDMNLSNSIATAWKNRGLTPKSETLSKIAQHFEVPMDFFLERPPFDNWTLINQDRRHFIQYVDADFGAIDLMFDLTKENVEDVGLITFIRFIDEVIEFARPTENGAWVVAVRGFYQKKEKASAREGERKVSDEDIKFALWGDTSNITDDDLEDVKRYAAFIRERKRKND